MDNDNSYKKKESDQGLLVGKLLLAMPNMVDPRFHQAVIYMVSHHAKGAMGIVINKVLQDLTFEQLLQEAGLSEIALKRQNVRLLNGGPVEMQHGFLIHTPDFKHENSIHVDERISVSANLDALRAFAEGETPKEGLLALGYAGWSGGQLEKELQENSWLACEADYDLLFNTDQGRLWDRAYARLGVDPRLISLQSGLA